MAVLIANRFSITSGAAGGGTQDMVSASWGEVAGVLTGPTDGTINAATSLRMQVGAVDAGRFDSSLNFMIGRTSGIGSERLSVQSAGSNTTAELYATNTTTTDNLLVCRSDVSSAQTAHFAVKVDGDCENTNGTYTTLSDVRIKRNVAKATSQIDDVEKLGQLLKNFDKALWDSKKGEVAKDNKGVEILHDTRQLGWVIDDAFTKEFSGLVKIPSDKNELRVLKQSIIPNKMCGALSEVITALKKNGIL